MNILAEEQAGFRKGYSTIDHILNLKCLIDLYLFRGKKLYCAFIDYKKALILLIASIFGKNLEIITLMSKCLKLFIICMQMLNLVFEFEIQNPRHSQVILVSVKAKTFHLVFFLCF